MDFFCISSKEREESSYFKGYAFTNESLVMNQGGYVKYRKDQGLLFNKSEGGRFVLFERDEDFFRLKVDPSGQCIIYYYKDADFWAVSDSLLELSKEIAKYGVVKEIYQPSVDVFKNNRLSLVGGQLVSNNTVVGNIKILGLDEYLELSWIKGREQFLIKKLPGNKPYADYEEFLYDFVSSWRGRLSAISNLQQESYLALSGGVDSRAILALWETSLASKKINCHSHKKIEHEYEIAKQLCALSGQVFGPGMKGLKSTIISAEESYQLSMSGNASVKTNFGFRRIVVKNPKMHFIGGCAIGSFYMKSSYEGRAERLIKQFGRAGENVANEIGLSLKSLGIDQDDPWAMFHHYYNFRARYHYGNDVHTQFGAVQVQPLLDNRLHGISPFVDKKYVEGNGVVRDLISIASGKLLDVPFDSPNKVKAKRPRFSKNLASVKGKEYSCYCGEVSQPLSFKGSAGLPEVEWYKELKSILSIKKRPMIEMAKELGFDDFYINQAVDEIDSYSKNSRLRKSGVLLGMYEIFNS